MDGIQFGNDPLSTIVDQELGSLDNAEIYDFLETSKPGQSLGDVVNQFIPGNFIFS